MLAWIRFLPAAFQVPKSTMPKSEMPQSEMPQSEMPQSEMPQSEMPQSEMPKSEMPKSEMPDLPSSMGKANAFDTGLVLNLKIWCKAGLNFTRIFLFKTELTASGKGLPMGMAHHQGVVLENAGGFFLQMDFCNEGLHWKISEHFPDICNRKDWKKNQAFKNGTIAPDKGDPQRLLDLLNTTKGMRYHLMKFNCQNFAKETWAKFMH